MESLEFMVTQFLWYWWVALTHKSTSSKIPNLERIIFLTNITNRHFRDKLHPHAQINEKPTIHENCNQKVPRILPHENIAFCGVVFHSSVIEE